jgi:nucleotide-binding universal stress UspA family protein
MKFLIAIKDKSKESKNILDFGCKIAEGFSADLTICYIGKKSKALIEGDINLTRKNLAEWNIYHPGLDILEWAFNILKNYGFTENSHFDIDNLVEENGRFRMFLPKTKNYQIRLVLREGELLSELNKEVEHSKFDITIMGDPKRKRMSQRIIQFLNTSTFFVKNINTNLNYKILLCVDDSRATKRAVILSTRISKQFDAQIILLTVSKTAFFGQGYRNAHMWANRYLKRANINFNSKLIIGDPVDIFVKEAKDDHIIIMGKAKGREIVKFFVGSKPAHTVQKSNCPILLVN